jgi:2-(3-amino-3-carboxypropyl)histidine synthase
MDAPPQRFSARAAGGEDGGASPGPGASTPQPQLPIVPSSSAAAADGAAPAAPPRRPLAVQQVPDSILRDPLLQRAKSVLPTNYNFEVEKTIWRVKQLNAKVVALQLPEGLLMFALALSDLVERFGGASHCLVLADVTYGACCVDDLSAQALGCDLLVHYGHSCLVPVGVTAVPCMYVFVDIAVDVQHLVGSVRLNFPPAAAAAEEAAAAAAVAAAAGKGEEAAETGANGPDEEDKRQQDADPPLPWPVRRLALAGTIQFSGAVAAAKAALLAGGGGENDDGENKPSKLYPPESIVVPKARPLSPGEVLGCTAPKLPGGGCCGGGGSGGNNNSGAGCGTAATPSSKNDDQSPIDALVFVADGRFHLEAIMIANPTVPAFRYDPYSRLLTRERYDHRGMRAARRKAVEAARAPGARWGVVLGTLGRQGNPRLMRLLQEELVRAGGEEEEATRAEVGSVQPNRRPVLAATVLLSEVTPQKLAMIGHVDVWVQVACPRLSIDWGEGFQKPTLTPYEALVALGRAPATWWDDGGGGGVEEEDEEEEEEEEEEDLEEEGAAAAAAVAAAAVGSVSLQPSARREERRRRRREQQQQQAARPLGHYPMDYYAADGGEWSSTYHRRPAAAGARVAAAAR